MSSDAQTAPAPPRNPLPGLGADAILAAVCLLVIALYAWCASSGLIELRCGKASETYYNLLVRGFSARQLNLRRPVPPGLAQLRNPYDPAANLPYRWDPTAPLHDTTFYHGKLYLYFGVTPALLLFWPWRVLTGHYLLHQTAVTIFSALGFLAGTWLLRDLWRRYFAEVSFRVLIAGVLAFGLGSGLPVLLARSDVYEVAISCGFALLISALALWWCSWHDPRHSHTWLALAGCALGLAVGARPTLLFGAVILLGPALSAWLKEPRNFARATRPLLAAALPMTLLGSALMLYNYARFANPFDFGLRRQLTAFDPGTARYFSPHFLWFNLRTYLLEPFHLSAHFPFVQNVSPGGAPPGHVAMEEWFGGAALGMPLIWLALCAPLALRQRSGQARRFLRSLLLALTLLILSSTTVLALYFCVVTRFFAEFVPALTLLAVLGLLAIERTFAANRFLSAFRLISFSLFALSVAFNLLISVERRAQVRLAYAEFLQSVGSSAEAAVQFQKALSLSPGHADTQKAQTLPAEALADLRAAARLHPHDAASQARLAYALVQAGQLDEAVEQFQKAIQIRPDSPEAHNDLAVVLLEKGDAEQAVFQFYQALKLAPDNAFVRTNLIQLFARLTRDTNAVARLQRVVQLTPEWAQAHYSLAVALQSDHQFSPALVHYKKALDLEPQNLAVQSRLAWLLATCPDASLRNGSRSLELARQIERLSDGRNPQVPDILAAAFAETGQFDQALQTATRACALAASQTNQPLLTAIKKRLELYQAHSAYHDTP